MKNLVLSMVVILFCTSSVFGQDREKYNLLINEAWSLYESKDYLQSANKYEEAFVALGNKGNIYDRYNAACSWALSGNVESAFVQLYKIANNGNYTEFDHMMADEDLLSLHGDKRWGEVTLLVKQNKEKAEANLDKNLMAILDTVHNDDQKHRLELPQIEATFGRDSKELKDHWKLINEKDSINLIKVKKILDERGWLGQDIVGGRGNGTLFLVIQHSDIETQQKYLPMMREAVKKGNASPSSLALLEDRVALRTGEKQIYGSQIGRDEVTGEFYVLPLVDPLNVDARRAEVGLGKLDDYLTNWNLAWDAEEYMKKLPEYEAKSKNK